MGLDELRTILSESRGLLEAFSRRLDGRLDEADERLLATLRDRSRRAEEVVDALTSYDLAQRPPERDRVELDEIVRAAAAVHHDAHPEVELDLGRLPAVMGDREQLYRVVSILLENAVKYRRPNIASVIRVQAMRSHDMVVLEVEDNGIGIDEHRQDEVFAMYESRQENREAGAGIGLAACRQIIEAHGGTIWAEAGRDGGTVMALTLEPADPPEENLAPNLEEPAA